MANQYDVSKKNRVRQLKEKAHYDRALVHEILDAALSASVAFVQDGQPVVVPMLFGRQNDVLFLHGARKARIVRLLESTGTACINVTHLDGLVFARSVFNSSMNYRSATLHGRAELIEDRDQKLHALQVISECTMPGRWVEVRESHDKEIKMTGIIRFTIDSASAKVSTGMPEDEDEDYDIPIWAGVLPLQTRFTELQSDQRLLEGVTPSDAVTTLQGKML